MTHCISPSEYCNDYYNNNSFNKIKLQLHASSTVSNPYNFSIKSNTGFSGVVQSALPTTETLIFKKADDIYYSIFTDTIPNGVDIIKVSVSAVGGDWYGANITVKNNRTNKFWAEAYAEANNFDERIVYIAVTSGKTYTINIDEYTEGDSPGYCYCAIYYSAEINTHTPDVEDY